MPGCVADCVAGCVADCVADCAAQWKGAWADSDTSRWTAEARRDLGPEQAAKLAATGDGLFWLSLDDFCKYFQVRASARSRASAHSRASAEPVRLPTHGRGSL